MPSLNTGNAILSNAIAVDSSYNVSINGSIAIGAASASTFKAYIVGDVFLLHLLVTMRQIILKMLP